jgi:hypothetical protein
MDIFRKDIRALGGIRTRDLSRRAVADMSLIVLSLVLAACRQQYSGREFVSIFETTDTL